jgi:hypothetical protein
MRAALWLLALAPVAAAAERKPVARADPRAELRVLETVLARAANVVARPSPFVLAGPECRGYLIEGVGAVFVLPPRALRSRNVVVWRLPRRGAPTGAHDRQIRILERQAEVLQREAARTHAQVEQAMAEMQRELEQRLEAEARGARAGASAPPAPQPPAAPAPPLPPEPALPPWEQWFGPGESEEAEAPTDVILARMRDALAGALAEHGLVLKGLRPDETIAAAVDFVPSFPFDGEGTERTLVLRVRQRDLEEKRAGRIGSDQLRARIEVVEY